MKASCIILSIDQFYYTPSRTIEERWDVTIPSTFSEIYHISSDNFYSAADSYTVYTSEDLPFSYLDHFSKMKSDSIEFFVKEISQNLEVEKKYRPDFNEDYYYRQYKKNGNDQLVILYEPNRNLCVYVQSCSWD